LSSIQPHMGAKLDAIGLAGADLGVAVAFYRRLGVDFGDPVDPEGHGHAEADLGGGFRLLLDTVEGIQAFDPKFLPASGDPRDSLAFRCSRPPDVDELYAELVKSGGIAHKAPWDAFWGQRYGQLRDPASWGLRAPPAGAPEAVAGGGGRGAPGPRPPPQRPRRRLSSHRGAVEG